MFNADKLTIDGTISSKKLIIPFFQRNYVWEEELWEKYWETMVSASNAEPGSVSFLGSIVLKQEKTPSSATIGDVRFVIDGQQRLITTFLFFKAVCTVHETREMKNFYVSKFYNTSSTGEQEIRLCPCQDDEEAFNEIIKNNDNKKFSKQTQKNQLYKCYEYFCDKAKNGEKINLDNCIKNSCFVVIDLDDDDDAQQIFNTINDIGLPLTTAQLLKNFLFKGREQKREHDNYWAKTFEGEKRGFWDYQITSGRERRTNIDVFLQAFFNLYNGESTNKKSANKNDKKLDNLYARYKNLPLTENTDRENFLKNLKDYGDLYYKYINPNCIKQEYGKTTDKNQSIEDKSIDKINLIIFSLNTTTIIPYVLFILKNIKSKEEQGKMLLLVESYVMRRFICNWTTKNYNNIFATLHSKDKSNNYDSLRNWMKNKMNTNEETSEFPSNKHVESSFQNAHIKNKNARVVLYFIEMYLHDKEKNNGRSVLLNYLRAIKDYSIEHIMPKEWAKNWKSLPDGFEAWQREEKIKTLGNLILLTKKLNSELSNSGWNKKKKALIQYSGGVKTFEVKERWSEKEIEERTKFLTKKAMEIWSEP